MGMYGPLTRSVEEWTPNRLLCKRFNVQYMGPSPTAEESRSKPADKASFGGADVGTGGSVTPVPEAEKVEVRPQVDAEKNEALEGERAADEVFRNIFGDSDDDE
jgi:G patch domain-containing protein 1